MAGMYAVFALVLQVAPETFGRALDGADDEPGNASPNAAGQAPGQPAAAHAAPAASQHS